MQNLFFVLAGVLFGLANVIPGVSGGTMAVVFGVYERLIGILSDPIKGIKKEWKFILVFGVGAVIGILAFGKLMNWLLERYPAQSAMFFVGVILGSLPMLFKSSFMQGGKVRVTAGTLIAFLVGFGIMIPMIAAGNTDEAKEAAKAGAVLGSVDVGQALLMLVYGVIASSTMIIPGISGSFVMLLLGVYGKIIAAVAALTSSNLMSAVILLLPFGIGVVLGLVFCSKLIKFLLKKYPNITYAAIFGFVVGSIGCVFPGFKNIDLIGVIALIAGIVVLWACDRLAPESAKE
ncbi:MAG: DUF368 domain-containing protein [Clostridia bacterium]|nr:DUF368 domain-containing protein [Clostridia bacterium]